MSRFLHSDLLCLAPYVPGEQPKDKQYVKLNTNESPYPPSPKAIAAASKEEVEDLRLYSDPESTVLKQAIADYYCVKTENVLPTNGSDETLAFCFRAFCEKGVRFPDVTYGFYPVFCDLFGITANKMPLNPDFTVKTADYLSAGQTVVLANPNAQTGIYMPLSEIEAIVQSNPDDIVVVDEAYIDFGGQSAVQLTKKYDNLVVVQTFSKSRSLAGARVGFAIACKDLIDDLNRVKYSFHPYNVNRLSGKIAAAAIADRAYFEDCRGKIMAERERLKIALSDMGFTYLPSLSNFVLAKKQGVSGEFLYQSLKQRGILIRHFKDERIADYIRITVGTPNQTDALLYALQEILV